jgi:D-alanine-D-alanine ligase
MNAADNKPPISVRPELVEGLRQAQPERIDLGKVAVLMGGSSAEREISLMSGTGVLQALRAEGVDAHAFDPAGRDLGELKREGFARCFIALHGRFGEDGTVQGALELLGIPYTGSGVMASSIAIDKVMTKRIWRAEGLATPAWRQVASGAATRAAFAELGEPMIVKPAREGSSIGLTKVTTLAQCDAAYAAAAQEDEQVLCEQFISGDEVTVPVLGTGAQARALPVIRIVAPGGNYDYQNKYFTDDTRYLVPCGLPAGEEEAIQQLVLQAYRVLGCRGWARADVMIDARTRRPYLLEINTSPGMTGHSLVPMSARAAGIDYPALCVQVLRHATLDHAPAAAGVPGRTGGAS